MEVKHLLLSFIINNTAVTATMKLPHAFVEFIKHHSAIWKHYHFTLHSFLQKKNKNDLSLATFIPILQHAVLEDH